MYRSTRVLWLDELILRAVGHGINMIIWRTIRVYFKNFLDTTTLPLTMNITWSKSADGVKIEAPKSPKKGIIIRFNLEGVSPSPLGRGLERRLCSLSITFLNLDLQIETLGTFCMGTVFSKFSCYNGKVSKFSVSFFPTSFRFSILPFSFLPFPFFGFSSILRPLSGTCQDFCGGIFFSIWCYFIMARFLMKIQD